MIGKLLKILFDIRGKIAVRKTKDAYKKKVRSSDSRLQRDKVF